MNLLNPFQVSALLQAGGAGSTVYLIGAGGCGMSGLGHLLLFNWATRRNGSARRSRY